MKLGRHLKLPLCQTYWTPGFSPRGDGANFSNWDIPLAQNDGLPFGKLFEIAREVRFCFMDIDSYHGLILA